MTLLTDELKQWIGREVSYIAPEKIGRASIRYFALAIGDENRLYFDEEYAMAAGYAGVIAPPTFICETNQYAHRQPNADGYIGHSWDLPLTGCRMIRGGHDYEFERPVSPEDQIKVKWRLEDISEHISSRGGTLLRVIALAVFSNLAGEAIARNRETLIFEPIHGPERSASRTGSRSSTMIPDSQPAPSSSDIPAELHIGQRLPTLERNIDLVRMIAYAGATWDWARLHYDPAYVAERDLPAPVIDGQMLGALVSELLLDWLGTGAFIRRLRFRLQAMAFAGDTLRCGGEVTAIATEREHRLLTVSHHVSVGTRLIADGSAEVRIPARWEHGR